MAEELAVDVAVTRDVEFEEEVERELEVVVEANEEQSVDVET